MIMKQIFHTSARIFHCLRRRYSVVMRLLMLLVDADPPAGEEWYKDVELEGRKVRG